MKLTLHIGMPRCGGIAIQRYLETLGQSVSPINSPDAAADLLLLGKTEHVFKEYNRRYGEASQEKAEAFKLALKSSDLEHIVLSSVMLYDLTDEEFIGNLIDELDPIFDDMQAIVYLRRQVDDFPELVTQRVKAGMTDWQAIQTPPDNLYRYDQVCRLWEQDIDLVVRDYGRCQDDIVSDFCKSVGLNAPDSECVIETQPSFDEAALKLLFLVNNCSDPLREDVRRRIASDLETTTLGGRPYNLHPVQASEIEKKFEDGNLWVSNTYLNSVALL